MEEYDFLTPEEEILAAWFNSENKDDLDISEPPSIEKLIAYSNIEQAQYAKVINKRKLNQFNSMIEKLKIFAQFNSARLRISTSADNCSSIIELKMLWFYGGTVPGDITAKILSETFLRYPSCSVEISDGKYILIKFFVDLTSKFQIADYEDILEELENQF